MNNAIQSLALVDIPNKSIQINCLSRENNCVVEIIDNGPGIKKDDLKSLFELLNSDKPKGMGLGLWLCSRIMENFSGKISYEDAQGGGAKFILILPTTPRNHH
jgi:C4-dicarboxylate-specific signal transduction histidine kinase